jgi:hypothetical protein
MLGVYCSVAMGLAIGQIVVYRIYRRHIIEAESRWSAKISGGPVFDKCLEQELRNLNVRGRLANDRALYHFG